MNDVLVYVSGDGRVIWHEPDLHADADWIEEAVFPDRASLARVPDDATPAPVPCERRTYHLHAFASMEEESTGDMRALVLNSVDRGEHPKP